MTPLPVTETTPVGYLAQALRQARAVRVVELRGRVAQLNGPLIESEGPFAALGELCRIQSARRDRETLVEVVGFRSGNLLLLPLGPVHEILPGNEVIATGAPLCVPVGDALLGRVIDSLGHPLDGLGPIDAGRAVHVNQRSPHPVKRQQPAPPLQTGIDAVSPCCRGQRLGILAGRGAGKSAWLGRIACRAEADVNVIALVGERGREVSEFLENDLHEDGRRKSVVVVATADEPVLARVKSAFLAMAIAEHFRDEGRHVLLLLDSVTGFAVAQREIDFAVGGSPALSLLPQLLDRIGISERGSITGLFTLLLEADGVSDPIAEAMRPILDGQIALTSELARTM